MKRKAIFGITAILTLALAGIGIASAHGPGFGFGPGNMDENGEIFGIPQAEFQSLLKEGKTIKEIAESQGIDLEQWREERFQERKELMEKRTQALIDAGLMTQEEADARTQWMEERHDNFGERPMMKGPGFSHGHCGDQPAENE